MAAAVPLAEVGSFDIVPRPVGRIPLAEPEIAVPEGSELFVKE